MPSTLGSPLQMRYSAPYRTVPNFGNRHSAHEIGTELGDLSIDVQIETSSFLRLN